MKKTAHVQIGVLVSVCFLLPIGIPADQPKERAGNDAPAPIEDSTPAVTPFEIWKGLENRGRYIPEKRLPQGSEVAGIRVSLEVEKTRVAREEPIAVDFEISNAAPRGSESYHTYVPWALGFPSPRYEIRAVDGNGKDRRVWGGVGKEATWDVLHLPPGRFCGFRTEFELPPGKYRIYAVFKNQMTKPPLGISWNVTDEQVARLSEEKRAEMWERVRKQTNHFERGRERLGDHELWTGKVISEKVAVEVTGAAAD